MTEFGNRIDPPSGEELTRSWIKWSMRLDEFASADLERFMIYLEYPEHDPTSIVMSIDPRTMSEAFPLLAKEGQHYWPDTEPFDPFEAAWRMLSIDLDECVASLEGINRVELSVRKRRADVRGWLGQSGVQE